MRLIDRLVNLIEDYLDWVNDLPTWWALLVFLAMGVVGTVLFVGFWGLVSRR